MQQTVSAYAVKEENGQLEPFEYELGPLASDEIDIQVQWCGVCHSDLSMIQNDWQMTSYPLVPGHEVTGVVAQLGEQVSHLQVGQPVGLGWCSRTDLLSEQALRGDHNLDPNSEMTIVGRHGGFADRVRCQAAWAVPLPEQIRAEDAGPLFCGGITVFNPIVQTGVLPTDRVAVVGIGGLGHMAIQFLNKWGCDVTAFTSTESKQQQAMEMGAHATVNSRDSNAFESLAGSFDFILSTVNVPLDWEAYVNMLRPRGHLHLVGVVPEPVPVSSFPIIVGQRSIGGSPLGSPATIATMLEFCARHDIRPFTEHFPLSEVNDAMEHLKSGKARYRVVLDVA